MIHLVTGGTRSGKSGFAEHELKDCPSILYIATGYISDDEMAERVKIHQDRRGERYRTFEGHKDIAEIINDSCEQGLMLECVGTLITNMIFDKTDDVEKLSMTGLKELEKEITEEISHIIEALKNKDAYIISNEVGMGLISEYKLGRVFTDILGRTNQLIASKADKVTLMVSGLPIKVK